MPMQELSLTELGMGKIRLLLTMVEALDKGYFFLGGYGIIVHDKVLETNYSTTRGAYLCYFEFPGEYGYCGR